MSRTVRQSFPGLVNALRDELFRLQPLARAQFPADHREQPPGSKSRALLVSVTFRDQHLPLAALILCLAASRPSHPIY